MSNSPPPDLRVLCRKLASLPPTQLPHALPSLINHVLHLKEPLSAPQEQKVKGNSSESAQLVHKLKATITTLLNGRSREARFAAVALVKAMVDVGGWQVLQGSEPWVRGLLSVVQKADPLTSKELAVVTLTRIYMLVHPYQTLVREIATPSIPAFVTACLSLIKQPASSEGAGPPLTTVETICDAFSALIPLYPTTFRPSSSQIRSATRIYLAPTESDFLYVPQSLQAAARRTVISLHHVAAKSGGAEEWAKLVNGIVRELHATADQVLRAVQETWEGSSGFARAKVELDGEPHGGSTTAEELPPWTGVSAGAERLIGLFHYLAICIRLPTKAAVTIPTSVLVDAVSRVCLIARLSPKSQSWDQALQTNAAIGRDEKDELWAVMPSIHTAAFDLIDALAQRLEQNFLPLVPEVLDHLVRVIKSGINIASVRKAGYATTKTLLLLAGPTLAKSSVDSLDIIISACCRDLQEDAGYFKPSSKPDPSPSSNKKNGSITANADLFLQPQAAAIVETTTLEPDHKAKAEALLAILPSHLPQRHLRPAMRGVIDQTAVLIRNRDAMVASVLNPYQDQRGRTYPNILPQLTAQFPHDPAIEVLRTNLRAVPQGVADGEEPLEALPTEEDQDDEDEEMASPAEEAEELAPEGTGDLFKPTAEKDLPIQSNPFGAVERAASPPKRKHDGVDVNPPKRQTLEKSPSPALAQPAPMVAKDEPVDEEDESDDESVHLNMELDEDDDEEDEEDE